MVDQDVVSDRRPAFRGIQRPTDTRTTEGGIAMGSSFVALVVVAAGFPTVHAQSLRAATTVYPVCQYSSYHNYAFQAVSKYSYAGTGYHEGDDGSTPAGAIPYELLYAGYNYSLGSYDWQYYYANLSTPRDTIHMKNFPFARPSAGGEVGQTYKMSVQMRTRGVPAFQIKGRDSVWRNWTTFFATKICADSGFRYTVEGAYQDFAIEGYAAGVGQ